MQNIILKLRKTLRRTKLLDFMDNSRVLFYCSLGLLALSLTVLAFAAQAEHRSNANIVRSAAQQVPLRVGQKINLGSATMTISGVQYSDGSSHFAAPAGKHYLIFNLAVRNYSEKPIHVLPANDTYVKDNEGNVVYLTPYELSHPFRAGELSPGEQITGQLSFLVDKSAKSTFYIDAIWSGGVVPIALR